MQVVKVPVKAVVKVGVCHNRTQPEGELSFPSAKIPMLLRVPEGVDMRGGTS